MSLLLLGCANQKLKESVVTRTIIESTALANSQLNDKTSQSITIYLPPSYDNGRKLRYPVIYFLHGFGEKNNTVSRYKSAIDEAIINQGGKEFIVVEPNGSSVLGGSFFYNSSITGNWEDFIVKEVIGYVDSTYRTIPDKKSRGIAGFSMGGTGAINIAFK